MSHSSDELQNLLLLKEQLAARRRDDPLALFEPHQKQRAFIDAVMHGENTENWLCSANRFGKSDVGAFCGATLARYGLPEQHRRGVPATVTHEDGTKITVKDNATSGWVVGLDNNVLRDTVQPKYFDNGYVPPGASHQPFIPEREIKRWDKEANIATLKNGSLVGFKSCEAETQKFAAAGKDWIHYDEVPPHRIYEESSFRIEAGRPLLIFGTATLLPPEGIIGGINWVYSEIIKPFMKGNLVGIGVFGGSIYDNPHLAAEEVAKLESKWPPTSTVGRIRLGGEWLPGLLGSRAYASFDSNVHVKELGPMTLEHPICWCWDFNVEPMITEVGQKIGPRFRFHDELMFETGGDIDQMCELFYQKHALHHQGEIWLYADATGGHRSYTASAQAPSALVLLQRWFQLKSIPLRVKVPESNPLVPDRVAAVNTQLRSFEGHHNIEIDPRCRELIDDLDEVILNSEGVIKKTTNRKDPYFWRTHASDSGGYWIAYEAPVRTTGRRAGNRRPPTRPSYGTQKRTRPITVGTPR